MLSNTLRPKFLKEALKYCVEIRDPAFVWGPPGCGKSQIMKAIAEELGYIFIDIRMSQMDAIDLRGMPVIPKQHEGKDQVMIWALPDFLPKDHDTKAIIFFDEMNHAIPTNLSAAYQLIQERKLGSYELPENVVCFAAGNRKGDYGSDFDLPAPLADRFTHLEIAVNSEDWIEWALQNGIDSSIIGFIKFADRNLTQYDEMGKSLTFATPRSWARVNDHIRGSVSAIVLRALIAGRVGDALAGEFLEYRDRARQLPDSVAVLTGEVSTLDTQRIDILYCLSTSLGYKLSEFYHAKLSGDLSDEEYAKLANNFLKFTSENFTKIDILIMSIKTAMVQHKVEFDPVTMPYFDTFLEKHGAVISSFIRR